MGKRHYHLFVKRLREGAKLPKYANKYAAGADLYACLDCASVCVPAGEERVIPLGIAIAVEPGFELQIRPRSGLRFRYKITVYEGTIDCDFRGELSIIVENHRKVFGYVVKNGKSVAQGVIQRVYQHEIVDVGDGELPEAPGGRGENGYGSTGLD